MSYPRIFFVILLCVISSPIHAQEWTRFRGPNGNGISDAATIPTKWTNKDYRWQINLPGQGASSPVIWEKKLFITSADLDAGERYLLCINTENGKEIWRHASPFKQFKKQKTNSYASGTPVVDKDHVYVLWQSPTTSPLIALDHDGKKVWEFDLGPYNHGQGPATSPIVHEDLVIIANDHKQGSFLIALDRNKGQQKWKIPREGKRACYSAPAVYKTPDGKSEIIFTHCFEGIIGVDPKTGKTNWHIDPFGRFPQRAISCPVFYQDLILACSGFTTGKKNLVAIRPAKDGKKVEEVYRLTKSLPHIPSPVVYKDKLYLWSDTGIISCCDAKTGKEIWKGRANGRYFSSPVCVNGKLYCISYTGDVVVVNTGEKFELLARVPLGEESQASPAVSGGVMYLRTTSKLFALGGK